MHILIPGKVILYNDNQNIIFDKELSRRIERLKALMQEYDYEIRKIKGKKNVLADTLSRINLIYIQKRSLYWDNNKLRNMQKEDCSLRQLNINQYKTKIIKGILTDKRKRIIIHQTSVLDYLKRFILTWHSLVPKNSIKPSTSTSTTEISMQRYKK